MGKITKALTILCNRFAPAYKNTVLFDAFGGQYNDNPKRIEKALHEKDSSIRIVWVKSWKSKEQFPEYAKTVEHDSKEYYKYLLRSQVVVDNHVGLRSTFVQSGNFKEKLRGFFTKKRKNQLCISTWHGTPLKRIAGDELNSPMKGYKTCSDYVVAGCDLTKNALQSAFFHAVPIKKYGTPRNDVLINGKGDIDALKEKLGLPKGYKIILFAPTFRKDVENSGVLQMRVIDFEKLLQSLRKRFGGEWCFVFRVHQNVLKEINVKEISEKYGERVINGNLHDDMAEYLLCTDILITDYSGSLFDFALTKRPCYLFTLDREHYEKEERGFYLPYGELPFLKADSPQELYEKIENFEESSYQQGLESLLKEIGNVEDGKASQRVADDIYAFIRKKKSKREIIK